MGHAHKRWLVVLALVLSDVLLALIVWETASAFQSFLGRGPLTQAAVASIGTNTLLWVGIRALFGLYPGYGLDQVEELRRQTVAVATTLAVTAVFALAFQIGDSLSRLLLVLGFLLLALAAPLARYLAKWGMNRAGLWGKPVVVIGAGKNATHLVRTLRKEWGIGFRPVAVFDNHLAPTGGVLAGVPYGGTVADAIALARRRLVDTAVFVTPDAHREHLSTFVNQASIHFRHVILVTNILRAVNSSVVARDLAGTPGIEIRHNLLDPWVLRAKRALDLTLTLLGGVLFAPLFLVLCLLVYLESAGKVFYRDYRLGRDGVMFSCLKFRTMVPEAEAILQRLLKENVELREEYSRYHKLRDDPRVTRVGRILRRTSLDELPQLWNVLRGEMSLVGPRPYLPRESEKMGPQRNEISRVSPGITGLWQVDGRSDASFEERIRLDAYYVHSWSVWLDIVILARTVRAVILARGAF